MAIDTSGKWWTGTDAADIDQYLDEYTESGSYPVERVEHARCTQCGGDAFRLRVDRREGCVERTCADCADKHLMLDSAESLGDAKLRPIKCRCGKAHFNTAIGFAHRDSGDVRWVYVGIRCTNDGTLGSCAEWGISYTPTSHLYATV